MNHDDDIAELLKTHYAAPAADEPFTAALNERLRDELAARGSASDCPSAVMFDKASGASSGVPALALGTLFAALGVLAMMGLLITTATRRPDAAPEAVANKPSPPEKSTVPVEFPSEEKLVMLAAAIEPKLPSPELAANLSRFKPQVKLDQRKLEDRRMLLRSLDRVQRRDIPAVDNLESRISSYEMAFRLAAQPDPKVVQLAHRLAARMLVKGAGAKRFAAALRAAPAQESAKLAAQLLAPSLTQQYLASLLQSRTPEQIRQMHKIVQQTLDVEPLPDANRGLLEAWRRMLSQEQTRRRALK